MRRPTFLTVLVMLFALTACTGGDGKPEINFDEDAGFSVFLTADVTEAQKTGVEAELRGLPGATEVTYESSQAAYDKMRERFEGEPGGVPDIDPSYLPQSFRVKMKDMASVRRVRDDTATGDRLRAVAGVRDLVFPACTTVEECRKELSSPGPR
ncbi:permease-like cell division protein FtsX [Actinoplanes friuliensis]|uniref:FtsX extracellular domain-containing protein n=1 Tax=Actinoplanes friuliensis DSM 7358 TaxID=1246995 RepID=U5VUQ7_9ACTN|nr:permease-like cell division protein FtsX [Actinoplanes friuliensis]AGZ40574.1 hypothetical protein AFR_11425 [Actinoplanes friuliensis DSM 7358]